MVRPDFYIYEYIIAIHDEKVKKILIGMIYFIDAQSGI